MRFQNKVVIISGGTRGIGAATARQFAKEGASLALLYKSNDEAADAIKTELGNERIKTYKLDIADPFSVELAVNRIFKDFGHIDILVNNAAYHNDHPIDEVDYEFWKKEWTQTINVNVLGTSNLTFCVAQHLIKANSGKIIFISSRGAFRGEPDMPAYGASKAAINAMSQSLAKKLAPYNIHVSAIAPGFVETEFVKSVLDGPRGDAIRSQSPLNRVAKPEEVAHTVLFLADEKSIWNTGAIIDLNGASYLRT